jgi:tetratricopeptide (TPR) repeat protein
MVKALLQYTVLLGIGVLLLAPVAQAQSDGLSEALQEVDRLRTEGDFRQAFATLNGLMQDHANNPEVLWRLSRTKVDIGEQRNSEDVRKQFYREALTHAEAAIAADSMNARAYLAGAIAAGRVGLMSGTREKVELSRTVKEYVDRAIELNPDLPAPYHVRARWNYEVASLGFFSRAVVRAVYGGLPDASYEAAVDDFERSIALDDRVVDRLELGRTYLAMDQEDEARAQLEKALTLSNKDPDDPQYKEEARELLRELD